MKRSLCIPMFKDNSAQDDTGQVTPHPARALYQVPFHSYIAPLTSSSHGKLGLLSNGVRGGHGGPFP